MSKRLKIKKEINEDMKKKDLEFLNAVKEYEEIKKRAKKREKEAKDVDKLYEILLKY